MVAGQVLSWAEFVARVDGFGAQTLAKNRSAGTFPPVRSRPNLRSLHELQRVLRTGPLRVSSVRWLVLDAMGVIYRALRRLNREER